MPFPFSRPLLATECSEHDTGAQALALALARRLPAPLRVVLPLLSNPELEALAPQQVERTEADAARRRQALEAEVAAAGLVADIQVRRGADLQALIVDEARGCAADIIVIRRRGRRGFLAQLLVGEMVSTVVDRSPCSVLVCPRAAQPWRQGVLVGLDPRAPQPTLLQQAADLALADGLPLHLVCVAETAATRAPAEQAVAAALERLRQRPDAQPLQVHGEVRMGRVHQALAEAARERHADLLVVGRQGAGRPARSRVGGTAFTVLGLAEGPVLVHVDPGRKDAP